MKPKMTQVTPSKGKANDGTITLRGREWTREEFDALMSDQESSSEQDVVVAKPAPEGDRVGAETKLEFRTAEQIATESPNGVDWIARPWVAKGAITEVDGQVKAAGKTTWMTHMCSAVLDGVEFMGQPTRKAPVVYLTEQPEASFRGALELAGLLKRNISVFSFGTGPVASGGQK
jgi:hypothetical protein